MKRLGLMPWVLVIFVGSFLFLGLTTASFAQGETASDSETMTMEEADDSGCTPEAINDPDDTECLPAGDAHRGQLLFTGEEGFTKDGAPCVSCHNVAGTMSWGGGTLGPDLTGIVGRLTEEGVGGVLSSLAFPTMAQVYEGKQLTKQEQADLKAFFVEANGKQASSFSWIQFWWGLGGFIVLLILQNIFWSGRFKGVRKQQIGGGN
jgi:cytochrome c2